MTDGHLIVFDINDYFFLINGLAPCLSLSPSNRRQSTPTPTPTPTPFTSKSCDS